MLLVACVTQGVSQPLDLDWNRMTVQSTVDAYEPNAVLPDGTSMQAPPPGTVPLDAPEPPPGRDLALLALGRRRFESVCAPCHGVLGDADTPVARAMTLRPPPSLHEPRILALSDADLVAVVGEGYGLMPGYGWHLGTRERWAIAAYVRALQLSRGAVLADLPADVRARAEAALP